MMMKVSIVLVALLGSVWTHFSNGFTPRGSVGRSPFFHVSSAPRTSFAMTQTSPEDMMSLEEEIESLVQAELAKNIKMSKLTNDRGVEFAPWMKMTEQDEKEIRQIMRERAIARRKRQEQEQNVKGALYGDSQGQELAGTGLKYKIVDRTNVELEWATDQEIGTKGFVIKRRPSKTDQFEIIASYQNYGPLVSKGRSGGVYRYLDPDVPPGGWIYRVSEIQMDNEESDLSQCLVEIQTAEEQRGALLAAVAMAVVAVGAVIAGNVLDPVQY